MVSCHNIFITHIIDDNQSKLDEFFVNLAESQKPLENDFQQVLLDSVVR